MTIDAGAIRTPLEMLYRWERETPSKTFLRQPKNLEWTEYDWAAFADRVRRVANWISGQGLAPGSRIAIWASNSKDWPIVDFAIMMAGHVSVPLYPGQDVASARYILEHSESRLIFLGHFDAAAAAAAAIPAGIARVAMQGCAVPCSLSVDGIIAATEPMTASPAPGHDDLFTLVYTSGTTGNPKGAMHSHATPGHVCPDLANVLRFETGNTRFFSYLPLSHVAERILVELGAVYCNGEISFSEGLATFATELRSVQPHFFFSVPRLWIKFKEGVDAKVPPAVQPHLTPEQKAMIAQQLGLSEARMIITGSAPCPRDVQQWFLDMGILLRDGYGMTENFIHGCSWIHNDTPIPGCVGRPFGETVQVRLGDGDEILFRSKGLMSGYYKQPDKTAEVLKDGWYHTGDSGRFDEDGNLWVTGRVSEVFKTSKGKFIRPTEIEDKLGACELMAQTCVYGLGMDQPVAVATLSELGKGMERDALENALSEMLAAVNAALNPWERLGRLYICADEWTIENGLLTPTMKLKRKPIEAAYRDKVEAATGTVAFEA